jgi:hypothetical protein
MLKQRLFLSIIVLLVCACNGNINNEAPQNLIAPSNTGNKLIKPTKVSGTFFGTITDNAGAKVPTVVTLTDTTFNLISHNKNAIQKSKLLTTINGVCQQDSGIIKLLIDKKVTQKFSILSEDSIIYYSKKGPIRKANETNYLVKKQ